MPEIHHIVVATRNPGDNPRDKGDSEEGFYTLEGDLLTMVSVDGAPLRNADGNRITARITDGTTPRQAAARLVLSRWRAASGDDGFSRDFNRPLHYRTSGWT